MNIGNVAEKESHEGGVLMEAESSGRRSDQPRPLAMRRTSGKLTEIGDVSTNGGDAIPMVNGEMIFLN